MSKNGIPNFDDPPTKSPFVDRDQEMIPKASSENFICLVGPCRHYHELTSLLLTSSTEQHRKIHRLCCRFTDDNGANMYLTEQTVKACSAYSPPIWNVAGWRRQLKNFQWTLFVYRKKSPGVKAWPKSFLLTLYVAAMRLLGKEPKANGN